MRFTLAINFRRKYGYGWEKENIEHSIWFKITLSASEWPTMTVEDTTIINIRIANAVKHCVFVWQFDPYRNDWVTDVCVVLQNRS